MAGAGDVHVQEDIGAIDGSMFVLVVMMMMKTSYMSLADITL